MPSEANAEGGTPLPVIEPDVDLNEPMDTKENAEFEQVYHGFDHMTWYVGNAKQAASYYITRMGFNEIAYRGIEAGDRHMASHVVSNGRARFVFISLLNAPNFATGISESVQDENVDSCRVNEIHEHISKHGDGVKDIAFQVDDVYGVWNKAVAQGARSVSKPRTIKDEDGELVVAVVSTYGDTTHTLIDRSKYKGAFMPGYSCVDGEDTINKYLPKVEVVEIDHCVGNQPWDGLEPAVEYYEKCLDFQRYWTVDDKEMCSDFSAMSSVVIASPGKVIKMPLNEPAVGKRKSQIEEFVDYYSGAGVQHIALKTDNIIDTVTSLRLRGVSFLTVPDSYYATISERLGAIGVKLNEDIKALQKLHILIDFDEGGYLLQIFTKHVLDRPTVFIEIIQRNSFDGFGAGNFKALFEAFEREQAKRGNL